MGNRIIELKNENTSLKKKLVFLEELLDNAPGLIYVNEIGKIGNESTMRNVYLNKYAIEITGYTREEADLMGP